jgi:hypothetical protein
MPFVDMPISQAVAFIRYHFVEIDVCRRIWCLDMTDIAGFVPDSLVLRLDERVPKA